MVLRQIGHKNKFIIKLNDFEVKWPLGQIIMRQIGPKNKSVATSDDYETE